MARKQGGINAILLQVTIYKNRVVKELWQKPKHLNSIKCSFLLWLKQTKALGIMQQFFFQVSNSLQSEITSMELY
jgi:hypothetical protein